MLADIIILWVFDMIPRMIFIFFNFKKIDRNDNFVLEMTYNNVFLK